MKSLPLALVLVTGCATATHTRAPASAHSASVPFDRIGIHFLVVPVRAVGHNGGRIDAKFIFDTGIGVSVISKDLCQQLGCTITAHSSGRRMSGQRVDLPLATIDALTVAGQTQQHPKVAVFDFAENNFGVAPDISGFLSLDFFRSRPFTLDYRTHTLVLEDAASLRERRAHGTIAPLRFEEEGGALDVAMAMRLPDRTTVSILVDTGSPALTLDERFMAPLHIARTPPQVSLKTGSDETGFFYTRYFSTEPVVLGIASGDASYERPIKTMFQKIIHDGVIGDAYLKQFTVTFDLPRHEIIFAP